MRRRSLSAVVASAVMLGSCAAAAPGVAVRRSDSAVAIAEDSTVPLDPPASAPEPTPPPDPQPNSTTPPPNSIELNPSDAQIDFGVNKTPRPYDEFLQASLADIQEYWRETFPQVYGTDYAELSGGIYAAYPERTEPIPGCGDTKTSSYEQVAEGGAFYCEFGDFIAYDDAVLVPDFSERLGNSAVAIVLAHEFGHAIQQRSGILAQNVDTVFLEQQADCFAGAWAAHVARGESASLTFGDSEIRSGLIAMVEVKDPVEVGVSVFDASAHGSAFDRVGAFQVGFVEGASRCAQLIDNPLPLLNLQFSNNEEVANGGNLPYSDIGPAVEKDLNLFWVATFNNMGRTFSVPTVAAYSGAGPFPDCDGVTEAEFAQHSLYCSNLNQVVFDDDFARELYDRFGDFAYGYLIGNAWGDAAQTQLGSALSGEARALANDCLVGSWTKAALPENIPPSTDPNNDKLSVSPGDLDEAVSTALVTGDAAQNDNIVGSSFEKIASFRSGVLNGISACGL